MHNWEQLMQPRGEPAGAEAEFHDNDAAAGGGAVADGAQWLTTQWLTARRLAMAARRLTATTMRAEATEWQRQQRSPSGRLRTPASFFSIFLVAPAFSIKKLVGYKKSTQI
jgi:hypothetical protein